MGGTLFKCSELSNQAVTKKTKAVPFEDRGDEDIDRGFDYVMKHCPRPAVETQQLRWMTKT